MLFDKPLLLLIFRLVFLEKPLEGFVGILQRILFVEEPIIDEAAVPVRQILIGLVDVVEFILGVSAVLAMPVGVPVGGEALVGLLDLEGGGVGLDLEDGVVVFEGFGHGRYVGIELNILLKWRHKDAVFILVTGIF